MELLENARRGGDALLTYKLRRLVSERQYLIQTALQGCQLRRDYESLLGLVYFLVLREGSLDTSME